MMLGKCDRYGAERIKKAQTTVVAGPFERASDEADILGSTHQKCGEVA